MRPEQLIPGIGRGTIGFDYSSMAVLTMLSAFRGNDRPVRTTEEVPERPALSRSEKPDPFAFPWRRSRLENATCRMEPGAEQR